MSVIDAIRPLVEAGFSVHWLREQSKAPLEDSWSSIPRKTIDQLVASYRGGLNVGVRLGEWSQVDGGYLHVIDLDVRRDDLAAEALARLASLLPSYGTLPFVISGSGGASRHFYFITDKPFASRKLARSEGFEMVFDPKKGRPVKKHNWEIELFGTGKQVAMPPSIHPDTGAEYAWGREFDWSLIDLGISPSIPSAQIEAIPGVAEATATGSVDERPPLGLTIDEAQDYLDSLPLAEWCIDRDGWYQVGMALHHEFAGRGLGGEAFQLWCQFSAQSDKFDVNDARRVWVSFKDSKSRNIRMATIVQASRQARFERQFGELADAGDGFDEAPKSASLPAAPAKASGAALEIDDLLGGGGDDLDDLVEKVKEGDEPSEDGAVPDLYDDLVEKKSSDVEWMQMLDYSDEGGVRNTFANIHLIIENDIRTKGLFERNMLLNGDVFRRAPREFKKKRESKGGTHQITGPAWQVRNPISGELVLDVHVAMVRELLTAPGRRGGWGLGKPASTDVREAIEIIARKNAFHPIRDYLDRLQWDGKKRVESLFVEYLGAEDNAYHRETARLTMLAAVTRAFEPGHKFDYVPVIEGGQGVRKSTFIEALAVQPDWFGELSSDFGDIARMVESMQGRWIMELAEMSGMNRSDVNDIKKFVTQTEDRVRLAYERSAANYPRQSIIMGSTNDDAYLRDDTGGRRFWPIRCQVSEIGGSIPIEKLQRNLEQMWAEAVAIYREMRKSQPHGTLPLYLADEAVRRHAERLQATRRIGNVWDDWAAQIDEWADTPVPQGDGFDQSEAKEPRHRLCALEIWTECLGFTGKPTQQDSQYIGNAMKLLAGKWDRSERITYPTDSKAAKKYGRPRGWVRRRR
jgi:predicted P-loop ATPase